MFPRLLTLALWGASVISAAPMSASRSTSEPTKAIVMVTLTATAQTMSSTIVANLRARQWEWTPSTPAWSEPAWTQPEWFNPSVVPVPTEPVWTPSMSYTYTEASTSTPTSTSDWVDTHRQDSNAVRTGWTIGVCVLAGIVGLGFIWYLITLGRRYCHQRGPIFRPKHTSDVEVNAGLDGSSRTPAVDIPPGPFANRTTGTSGGAHSIPCQSQDIADMQRLTNPHDDLARGPHRLSRVYQNNIPPQEAHWPPGVKEEYTTWTRGAGYREP